MWALPYARAVPAGSPPPVPSALEPVRVRLFVLFLVDPPVLLRALHSLAPADGGAGAAAAPRLPLSVAVLDSSASRLLSEPVPNPELAAFGALLEVLTPPVALDFQQSQNWVQALAYESRLHAFYVMHSDAWLESPSAATALLPFAEAVVRAGWGAAAASEGPGGARPEGGDEGGARRSSAPQHATGATRPLGVVFTNYDAVALYNPGAALATGLWDANFRAGYGADVDWFRRLRLAGFRTADARDAGAVPAPAAALGAALAVGHEGSHTLKSGAFECAARLRMDRAFEGEWRRRYLDAKVRTRERPRRGDEAATRARARARGPPC